MYPSVPFTRLSLTKYFAQITVQTPCLVMKTRPETIYLFCASFPFISTILIFWSNMANLIINNYECQQSKIYLTSSFFDLIFCFDSRNFMFKPNSLGSQHFYANMRKISWKDVANLTLIESTLQTRFYIFIKLSKRQFKGKQT